MSTEGKTFIMENTLINNSSAGRAKMKRRTFLQWMVIIVAFWSFIFIPFNNLSGMVSYLKYLPDGILLALLLLGLARRGLKIKKDVFRFFRIVLIFFVFCALWYLYNYQSAAFFVWGFRNIFRFYIAFFAFIAYLDEKDINMWFKAIDVLFWINVVLSCIQFFLLGIRGDYLGGIFGINNTSNGYTICFLSIVVGKTLLSTFLGKENVVKSMAKCFFSILVAAMAEIKLFFFIMVIIFVGAFVLTRFSVKKVIAIAMGLGVLSVGSSLLVEWFGGDGFFSMEMLWEKATQDNYSSLGDVNRLTAISSLIQKLELTPVQQLFGLGLGNCDTASIAMFNTPFYRTYGYLHYKWFASAMTFLETGYVGLSIYISFFVYSFIYAYKSHRKKRGDALFNQLAILMSVVCGILVFYNFSLRVESGYMMYFVLALPLMRRKLNPKATYEKG